MQIVFSKCAVIKNEAVTGDVFLMELKSPEIAGAAGPGQFVMIRNWEGSEPFFMRPISLNFADSQKGSFELLYKVVGKGTEILSGLRPGEEVSVLGPLGHGFPVAQEAEHVAVIGRGIGIAPLRYLVHEYRKQGTRVSAFLSAGSAQELYDAELMREMGAEVYTSTDRNALVTDKLAEILLTEKLDLAFSCGSKRLARAMKKLGAEYGFKAYVSLEEHMACGVGACEGCITEAVDPGTGERHYVKVCKDGPVFDADRWFDGPAAGSISE